MTISLKANADTYIDHANPRTAFGGSGLLRIDDLSGSEAYALLHIAIPGLAGASVQSAFLHLFLRGSEWTGSNHIQVDLLTAPFTEDDTWNTYHSKLPTLPGVDEVDFNVGSPHVDGTPISINVTALLADAAASGNWFGFLISTTIADARRFYSSEGVPTNQRPYLRIAYAQVPPAPTGLLPALGASAQTPKLAWTSADQTAFRIEVDRAATFDSSTGSPDYDSGWHTSTTQGCDIAALSPAWSVALPGDGDLRYWRVQIQNNVGAASDWAYSSWTRHSYGSVGITLPVSDGDAVDATSPEIDWSSTNPEGRYQLLEVISEYDSGEVDGNDLTTDSAEIPRGNVTHKGLTYTAVIRVWDTFTRDAPGEKGYVENTRDFIYNPTGLVTAPSSLTAVADDHGVTLTWLRASTPDTFIIFANGIDSVEVDPADVFVSGTTYRYRYLRAQPDVVTTYEVAAHDDTLGESHSNPTAVATTTPIGVWLVDEGSHAEVQFLGQDVIDMPTVEDGATFLPLGQRAPVRIVDQIRGYSGAISGVVTSTDDLAALGDIKGVPPGEGTIRVIFGAFNFPVDLGAVGTNEWPYSSDGRTYQWTAEFWQTGDPWPVPQ